MKNNKGFSLVEMIVAVTIASAVGVAIFGFMVVGAKAFGSSSADVNVQHESQLVFNQLQELIVDTNIGIDSGETAVTCGTKVKNLIMYNYDPQDLNKHVYEVTWDEASQEISYSEFLPVLDGDDTTGKTVVKGTPVYTDQLMGENIVAFDVDLSDMESKRVVRLSMTVEKGRTKYRSSHNITLRNKIITGGTIPTYIEKTPTSVDPEKVVGPENLYAEPGQVLELQMAGGYKVLAPGGADYPDQDIRFFLSKDGATDADTSVSTSGTLTVSKAQKNDFYVTVATRSGRGTALRVRINLIIVDSVDVTMVSRDDGKDLNDPLEPLTSFTLEAKVNGRNLDKSSNNMYAVKWDYVDDADMYVTLGAPTATATGATCTLFVNQDPEVENKDGLADFVIKATSVRSTQVPYYSGGKETPVFGTYKGTIHVDKGDFTIVTKGSILRGKHSDNSYIEIATQMASVIPGFNENNYVIFAGVKVNEYVYHQDTVTPSMNFTVKRDVRNSASKFKGEGTHLGIWAPDILESNPNSAFEYEVTFYVFKKRSDDYSGNWQTIRVFQPGDTECDGYRMSEADYRSNMVTWFCDRIFIYYDSFYNESNQEEKYKLWNGGEKSLTASFTPRALGNDSSISAARMYSINVSCSDNVEDNGITNRLGDGHGGFRIYRMKGDGSWDFYDDDCWIRVGGGKSENLVKHVIKELNQALKIKYNEEAWDDSFPERVRIVPYLKYKEDGQEKIGIMFDNYIDVYLWNIELPTINGYTTKKGNISRGYLPGPEDPAFAVMQGNYNDWKNPYPPKTLNYDKNTLSEQQIKDLSLKYKITHNNDGYGVPTYYVNVRYRDTHSGEWRDLAYYSCRKGERKWNKIDQSKVPDNLDF